MADNNIDTIALLGELQRGIGKLSDSMKGMATDIHEMNTRSKKREKNAINTKGKGEAEAQHERLIKMLKGEALDEEDGADSKKKGDPKQIKLLLQLVSEEKKRQKEQTDTNKYLKTLKDITDKNYKLAVGEAKLTKIQRRAEMTKLGRAFDITKGGASHLNNAFIKAGETDSKNPYSKMTGGLAKMARGLFSKEGGVNKAKTTIKEYTSGSRGRQYEIEKLRKDVNELASKKAGFEHEKEQAGKAGDTERVKKMQGEIDSLQNKIKDTTGKFSSVTATEFMYQRGKQDKRYANMSSDDTRLSQLKHNIHQSALERFEDKKEVGKKSTKKRRNRGGKLIGKMVGGNSGSEDAGEIGTSSDGKSVTFGKAGVTALMNAKIKKTKTPKTFGEYIGGIYHQLNDLNEKKMSNAPSMESSGGKKGGFGLGKWLMRGLGGVAAAVAMTLAGVGLAKLIQSTVQRVTGIKSGAGIQQGQGIEGLVDDAAVKGAKYAILAGGASRKLHLMERAGAVGRGTVMSGGRNAAGQFAKQSYGAISQTASGGDKYRKLTKAGHASRLARLDKVNQLSNVANEGGLLSKVAHTGVGKSVMGVGNKIAGSNIGRKIAGSGALKVAKMGGGAMLKGVKAIGKIPGVKAVGKRLGKFIPGVGLGIGLMQASQRMKEGDTFGAIAEVTSGLAGLIPGFGTIASMGIDAMLMSRDITESVMVKNRDKEQEEAVKRGLAFQQLQSAKQRAEKAAKQLDIAKTQDPVTTSLTTSKAAEVNATNEANKTRAVAKVMAEENVKAMTTPEYKDNIKSEATVQATATASELIRG